MVSINDYKNSLQKMLNQSKINVYPFDNSSMVILLKNYALNSGFDVEGFDSNKSKIYEYRNGELELKINSNKKLLLPLNIFNVMEKIDRKKFFVSDEIFHRIVDNKSRRKFNLALDDFLNTLTKEELESYNFEIKMFNSQCYKPNSSMIYYSDNFKTNLEISPLESFVSLILLNPKKGDKILEIGTYSGYTSALLSEMGCFVDTIQTHKNNPLDFVKNNLYNSGCLVENVNVFNSLEQIKEKKYDKLLNKENIDKSMLTLYQNMLNQNGKFVGLISKGENSEMVIAKKDVVEPFLTISKRVTSYGT